VPNILKSGSLNLLEPSGPVQACNGITLPLPIHSRSSCNTTQLINELHHTVVTCTHHALWSSAHTMHCGHLHTPCTNRVESKFVEWKNSIKDRVPQICVQSRGEGLGLTGLCKLLQGAKRKEKHNNSIKFVESLFCRPMVRTIVKTLVPLFHNVYYYV
jgi:hypothetical protein